MEFEKLELNINSFYEYLKINSIDNFEKIKEHVTKDEFKLKVKEDKDSELLNENEEEVVIDNEFKYIKKNTRALLNTDSESLQESILSNISSLKSQTDLNYEGYILINENYTRQKFKKNNFTYIRNIWGNTNSRFFRYVQLRKDPKLLNEYLKYFEHDKIDFCKYENNIMNLSTDILNIYRKKFILKEKEKVPFYFKDIIFYLHGEYLKNKQKINFNDVMIKLLEYDDKKLCFVYNKHEKHKNDIILNENKINNQTSVETNNQTSVEANIQNDDNLDEMELGP